MASKRCDLVVAHGAAILSQRYHETGKTMLWEVESKQSNRGPRYKSIACHNGGHQQCYKCIIRALQCSKRLQSAEIKAIFVVQERTRAKRWPCGRAQSAQEPGQIRKSLPLLRTPPAYIHIQTFMQHADTITTTPIKQRHAFRYHHIWPSGSSVSR